MKLRLYGEINDEPDVVVEGATISILRDYTTNIEVGGVGVGYISDFYGTIQIRSDYKQSDGEYHTFRHMEITA